MKYFLDYACQVFNDQWCAVADSLQEDVCQFSSAIDTLVNIFGVENVARKPGSRSFNRAIFDALVFYASDTRVANAMQERSEQVKSEYERIFKLEAFSEAVESDTAGIPHTFDRLSIWGIALRDVLGLDFSVPELVQDGESKRIQFVGLWGAR